MSKECCLCQKKLKSDVDVAHLFTCSHALCDVCLGGIGSHPLRQVCFTCATPDADRLPETVAWHVDMDISNTLRIDSDDYDVIERTGKPVEAEEEDEEVYARLIIGPIGPKRHLGKLGCDVEMDDDDDDVVVTSRGHPKELETFLRSMIEKRTEVEKKEAEFEARVKEIRKQIQKHAEMSRSLISRDETRLLQQLEETRLATLAESRTMRDGVGGVIDRAKQLVAEGETSLETDVEQLFTARVNSSVNFQEIQVALHNILPKDESNVVARLTFETTPDDSAILSSPALIGSIPGSIPITGIAVLDREVFIVNDTDPEVSVHQVGTLLRHRRSLSLLHLLTPAYIPTPLDMDACPRNRCLYVLDAQNSQVYRLNPPDGTLITWWAVRNPRNLSVTSSGSVLVTGDRKLVEYDPSGKTIRTISPSLLSPLNFGERAVMRHPRHAVEIDGGSGLAVSDFLDDRSPNVVYVTERCRATPSRWHGNATPASGADGFDEPRHLAVADVSGHVMVADRKNGRVVLLNRKLEFVRDLVRTEEVKEVRSPMRLRLDQARGHLYVGQSNGVTLVFRVLL